MGCEKLSLPLMEDHYMRRGMHFMSSYIIIDHIVYEPNQGRSLKMTESTKTALF